MKHVHQKILILVWILISIWFLVVPAYVLSCNLTEVDLFRKAHLENPLFADHLASLSKKWKGTSSWSDSSPMFFEGFAFPFPMPSHRIPRLIQLSPLRC